MTKDVFYPIAIRIIQSLMPLNANLRLLGFQYGWMKIVFRLETDLLLILVEE